jgi:glutamine cyclotransferase
MMFAAFLGSVQIFRNPLVREPPTTEAKVIRSYPHDSTAFTQGLFFEPGGTLLESTGLYGESSIRRVELDSGRVIKRLGLESDDWFGEGVTVQGGRCLQLLWREGLGLERHPRSFELQRTFPLPRGVVEGWGITCDGDGALYVSDGTSTVHVLEPRSLEVARTMRISEPGRGEVSRINELQWIGGEIYANIWREERIAVIEPSSGTIRRYIDLSKLLTPEERRALGDSGWPPTGEKVANGIAFDARRDRLYVTGKCWPRLFEIDCGRNRN